MLSAAFTAFGQVFSPLLRGVLLKSVALAIALLVVMAIGLNALLQHAGTLPYPWLDTAVAILIGVGSLVGAIYLMPAASALVAGFFLDDVAEKIERTSYPNDPVGEAQPLGRSLIASLRFFGIVLVVNIGALFLLLVPGVNIVIFFVANAYLLSREYFELAAMRYRSPEEARALRQANAVPVFLAGLLIAPVLMVPILNLITPVYGTALMVHFHRRLAPVPGAGMGPGPLIEGRKASA
ncbi:cysteine biosynthesis protein [Azorhizobium oxalatiphilum]|uniref:Cysteine biosynthesis protein n=1 Tax=Azorhizobium oxalatiphilum TaxID=980631 RepID=A0A917FIX9_9HYPH|nr:sulfate transporter family protein [Azorhizobium oxalatiphilum]GGF84922.1 cysteine biosynthesis protein [Azorhizobium oxalatiphilum]